MSAQIQPETNVARTRSTIHHSVEMLQEHLEMIRAAIDGVQQNSSGQSFEYYDNALRMVRAELHNVGEEAGDVMDDIAADANWEVTT